LYWVGSRSLGPTAVCVAKDYDWVVFAGANCTLGDGGIVQTSLAKEMYYYDDPELSPETRLNPSTLWAFKELDGTPPPPDDPKILHWILEQDLTFHQQRLETLESTPEFQGQVLAKEMIENERKNIELVRKFLQK
jgi:hypothetical protein